MLDTYTHVDDVSIMIMKKYIDYDTAVRVSSLSEGKPLREYTQKLIDAMQDHRVVKKSHIDALKESYSGRE